MADTGQQLRGIDISNHQGEVDLTAVARAGRRFVFMKASEGISFTDPFFERNWRNAKEAGLFRGAYHFSRPSQTPHPYDEADYFLQVVEAAGGLEPSDLLVMDIEDTNIGKNVDLFPWVIQFLQRVEEQSGCKPLLYSGDWYMEPHGLHREELADYGIWYASYQPGVPAPPKPWPVLAFWQYSDRGKCDGVDGNVDEDIFFGSEEQLRKYGLQPPQ